MSDPVALAIIGIVAATVSAVVALVGKVVTRKLDIADENAERREARMVEVAGEVFEIGKKVDGRLSELLASARAEGVSNATLARAEGKAEGEQSERDRSSEPYGGST